MAKKRKEDPPPAGAPAWMATFGDLMNLLLCFFVLLFAMSSVDAAKFEMIAASFSQTFSIFSGGGTSIGEGILISNGASQLNQLAEYINSTGTSEDAETVPEGLREIMEAVEQEELKQSEELAGKIEEALEEKEMGNEVDVVFTSQYVQLDIKGELLFDSGEVAIKEAAVPILKQVGLLLQRFAEGNIQIEGHTDNVPMSGSKYSNNNELSQGRALSIFNFLAENTTLDPAMIIHAGRGEYVPVADNGTPEGRARNRRVEIKIYHAFLSP